MTFWVGRNSTRFSRGSNTSMASRVLWVNVFSRAVTWNDGQKAGRPVTFFWLSTKGKISKGSLGRANERKTKEIEEENQQTDQADDQSLGRPSQWKQWKQWKHVYPQLSARDDRPPPAMIHGDISSFYFFVMSLSFLPFIGSWRESTHTILCFLFSSFQARNESWKDITVEWSRVLLLHQLKTPFTGRQKKKTTKKIKGLNRINKSSLFPIRLSHYPVSYF